MSERSTPTVNKRVDGRSADALRPISFDTGTMPRADGSALARFGETWVLCVASIEDGLPEWLRGKGRGWLTAEYAMHPRAGNRRETREGRRAEIPGRSKEIERLVGRALRSIVLLDALGERTVWIDCDVLQADGGTRTASVTGGFVALAMALTKLAGRERPALLRDTIAGVSIAWDGQKALLDPCYVEDRDAGFDLNVVATGGGALAEVQGTAEGPPLARPTVDAMLKLALDGTSTLAALQKEALGRAGVDLKTLLPRKP